jgi:hypothetical protein
MFHNRWHTPAQKHASRIIASHHKPVPARIILNGDIATPGTRNQSNRENTHPTLVGKQVIHLKSIPKLSPTFSAHILILKKILNGPIDCVNSTLMPYTKNM